MFKVALYSFFSLSFMFKSCHATASAFGPIVTKLGMMVEIWIGMPSLVKAPLHYQISLFSYVLNSQNPGYKFAQKIL